MKHVEITKVVEYIKNSWVVKGILSIFSAILFQLFGAWNQMLAALATLLVLDFVAKMVLLSFKHGGFFNAVREKAIRSKTMRSKTMYKVVRYAITLAAGNQVANALGYIVGHNVITLYGICVIDITRSFLVIWLCICELISIIETLVGVDGDELAPVEEALKDNRRKLLDVLIDSLIDKIMNKIDRKHNKEENK